MRRSTKFEENEDLDQSISDEEDLAFGVGEDCNFLAGSADNKGELHVLSQLEKLRDAHKNDHAAEPPMLSQKRQPDIQFHGRNDFSFLNNVGNFAPPRRSCSGGSDDEIVSDDEMVEKIVSSSSNAVLLKANRSSKGGRGRGKSKFSFHIHSHKDVDVSANEVDEIPSLFTESSSKQHLEHIENKEGLHSMSELFDSFQGKTVQHSEIDSKPADAAVERNNSKISVADLLDSVQENNIGRGANSSTYSKTFKRSTYKLGNRLICDDGSAEMFDSGSSSGDEDHRIIKPTEFKQKTMTDQFHEAFGISSINDETLLQFPRQSGIGLFGELQRVIQCEKEREMEFIRKLQTDSLNDESGCIDIRILSRCLEAKLTVCCCSFIRDEQSTTVIFSSRVSGDVELEPGNLIRIHPPWKKINITGKDKNVILSTYFSQIIT